MDLLQHQRNTARAAGAIVGVGLALVLLLVSIPGAASSPLPATVDFSVAPVGELEVTPPAPSPVLLAKSLLPGGRPASGSFRIRNQSGDRLRIHLSAKADSTALDGLLRVRLEGDGRLLADSTLQGLESHPVPLSLASGAGLRMRLEAWVPADVLSGYEARLVHVSLVPGIGRSGAAP
jgi:hypothetical protein